jgi:lysozyme
MISRRGLLSGVAALSAPMLAACGSRPSPPSPGQAYAPLPPPGASGQPKVEGLDAVIDISHNVRVSDFNQVRRSNILAVIHKATEGGDWVDPSYSERRVQAESAGLLWGAYHFGTRQYPGARQAAAFLAVARPGPKTLLSLDLEPNDGNPGNTMRLAQAEEFVRVVQQATGRLPVLYTHAAWANGQRFGKHGHRLDRPIEPDSILARCDLWLGDHREEPEIPYTWTDRGWRLWQYLADESEKDAAYGSVPRAIPGITHCDRNLFAGDTAALHRFWGSGGRAPEPAPPPPPVRTPPRGSGGVPMAMKRS